MPRIKMKGKKMLKLQSLSELSKIASVPDAAFPKEQSLEVPAGAFDDVRKVTRGEYPAYVRYNFNATSGYAYATFIFNKSLLRNVYKKYDEKNGRFELVQGKAPHHDWFMVKPAVMKRGNKVSNHGAVFHTKQYIDPGKLDKEMFYPLEVAVKDGVLFAKLPPELVPALL